MGKIKKILETELVGGTQSTDVYPVTSTKAVYDENNVRLDTILKPATKEAAGLMSPEDKKNIDDKLSKSQGGEIKKPIVVTNDDSDYKTIINPDGSIYVFSKNYNGNIFNIIPNGLNINISANNGVGTINIHDIVKLVSKSHKEPIYDANYNAFTASGFKLTYGTNEQVLLGDGSTTGKLVKDIRVNQAGINKKNTLMVTVQYIDGTALGTELPKATIESAGVMTADDKAKLDDIPNTYLPLSGGTLTGVLRLNEINSDQNGLDINNVNGMQSVDQDKVLTPEVWTTNGGSIDLINLFKNAAIYVAGGFEIAESGLNASTVVDNPDSIIFDKTLLGGRFLARKGLTCYTHWKADISKNIAPPSRYGIETDNGVFPFNNQMYKFSNYDNIYIATCSNGTCSMKKLTLE